MAEPAGHASPIACCIAGGGPAGMMLGYLMARAGVRTVVLEKHADFLRDFRGDTVHPSTLRIMDELGLLDAFLQLPHQKLRRLKGLFGDVPLRIADFGGLPERYAFIAFMPQWEFLDLLAREAARSPFFRLITEAAVEHLAHAGDRVAGVVVRTPEGPLAIEAIRKHRSVYLMAVGGAAYLVSKAIKAARVLAFEDLGMEAIYEFTVQDMPVTVAVDSLGESVHETGPREWRGRIGRIPLVVEAV